MHERISRFAARADKKRELLTSVMERADLRKLTEADFTVSLRRVPPPLVVIDEQAIPESYWVPQPARLDRQSLLAALRGGRDVHGAILGNAALSLAVRTK